MATEQKERDFVLAPNEFAHVLDKTKGKVNTVVGPTKMNMSDTETGVRFDPVTKKFIPITAAAEAIQQFVFAQEGDYVILENPASAVNPKTEHPAPGNSSEAPDLQYGRKINISGPVMFPLWPGQVAKIVKGHTLRSNQYLVVEVYNFEAAKANWDKGVTAIVSPHETGEPTKPSEIDPKAAAAAAAAASAPTSLIKSPLAMPSNLANGQKIIIRGNEISFYIPPTGITVLEDTDLEHQSADHYSRSAVTLERLEYCILMEENGNKRYERGPKVVFPNPTEIFIRHKNEADSSFTRRFRAYGLTKLQGLHIQVIADYKDDAGKDHKAGEELFIVGEDQAIYFPRPEHAIVKYGDQEIYNSITIPVGEGRYVLDRRDGKITLQSGPKMFLPDPRHFVLVRRVLTDTESNLWFPNNMESLTYNRNLRQIAESADAAKGNFVQETLVRHSRSPEAYMASATQLLSASNLYTAQPTMADEIRRGTTFKEPRQLTLDTRFDGAVSIRPDVGFAVKVVSKTGHGSVVTHPEVHLLEYDESLQAISFSTGNPKNDDRPLKTVYLRVFNNRVSDTVVVETSDMCAVSVSLGLRVNFTGDKENWFSVDNYVKLLCDHVRSKLSAQIKLNTIQNFYTNAAKIIRDIILGEQDQDGNRPGMLFEENGMQVYEVEVTKVQISNQQITTMLTAAAVDTFTSNLEIAAHERKIRSVEAKENSEQTILKLQYETTMSRVSLEQSKIKAEAITALTRLSAELENQIAQHKTESERQKLLAVIHGGELERKLSAATQDHAIQSDNQKLHLEAIKAEVDAVISKFKALEGPIGEILLSLSNKDTMMKLAEASSLMTNIGGPDVVSVINKIMNGAGFGEILNKVKGSAGNARITEHSSATK